VIAFPALAVDEPGSKDHPLVGRYAGSSIVYYRHAAFDEAALLQAPHNYGALLEANLLGDRSAPEWLQTEGAVTEIRYEIPPGRSSLEVIRNYQEALAAKGFVALFACADRACFTGSLQDPYLLGAQLDRNNNLSTAYFDHARYVLMRRGEGGAAVYAAILTGDSQATVTAFVHVVETKPMEGGKIVFPDAASLGAAIRSAGKVDVYGILFDFDKDIVRPESRPTLDAIAQLLRGDPALRLRIVGHTDNVGSAAYNLALSERRAASVVAALTRDYAIAGTRLASSGAGLTAPVAPNDSEDGRAKNRRVELRAE
jgi:outer membrane protein OmpA-like peptidoglycan-associated protein